MSGTLYVVATPIGNLDDLSRRARDTLSRVDLIAAEDTRHTGRLLSHLGVKTPTFALHEHNEDSHAEALVKRVRNGESIALVSDAGTPLLSDPGFRLLAAAHRDGVTVTPVPGPSAVTAALSVAGLPTDRFCFEGFLPPRSKARREALSRLRNETRTVVLFESVHRIADSLDDMCDILGAGREAFIGRELSKLHEQCARDTLAGLRARVERGDIRAKGEFVVVIHGAPAAVEQATDADVLLEELIALVPGKQAAEIAARVTGGKRNALYQRMLELSAKAD